MLCFAWSYVASSPKFTNAARCTAAQAAVAAPPPPHRSVCVGWSTADTHSGEARTAPAVQLPSESNGDARDRPSAAARVWQLPTAQTPCADPSIRRKGERKGG
jgi:hypothetical protein